MLIHSPQSSRETIHENLIKSPPIFELGYIDFMERKTSTKTVTASALIKRGELAQNLQFKYFYPYILCKIYLPSYDPEKYRFKCRKKRSQSGTKTALLSK